MECRVVCNCKVAHSSEIANVGMQLFNWLYQSVHDLSQLASDCALWLCSSSVLAWLMSFGYCRRSSWNISILTTCLVLAFFLQALTVKFRLEAVVVIVIVKGTLYRWDIFVQAIMLNCCMPK